MARVVDQDGCAVAEKWADGDGVLRCKRRSRPRRFAGGPDGVGVVPVRRPVVGDRAHRGLRGVGDARRPIACGDRHRQRGPEPRGGRRRRVRRRTGACALRALSPASFSPHVGVYLAASGHAVRSRWSVCAKSWTRIANRIEPTEVPYPCAAANPRRDCRPTARRVAPRSSTLCCVGRE